MTSITQIRYILAVHRFGHFGKAAEACQVTQPTLSAQIQKVERQFGFALFSRETKPVSLTRQGQMVVREAHKVLEAHMRFSSLANGTIDELSGDVVLGVIPTLAPYVVPLFLKRFAHSYPAVDLTVVSKTTEQIISELRNHQLDVGLLATPLNETKVMERHLFTEQFYVYAAREEELLRKDEIDPQDLDPTKLWLLEEEHCMRHQTLSVCGQLKGCSYLPSVRFEAGTLETVRHLVDASGGYTLVPECLARLLPKPQRMEQLRPCVEPAPSRQISLVHLATTWKSELINALWRVIAEGLPNCLRTTPRATWNVPARPSSKSPQT